jgi:hypothetical protein
VDGVDHECRCHPPDVSVDVSAAVRTPRLVIVAVALLVGGILYLVTGAVMFSGLRRRLAVPPEATAQVSSDTPNVSAGANE